MKTLILFLSFIFYVPLLNAEDKSASDLKRITEMKTTLAGKGVPGLLLESQKQTWQVPHIPSQWHVEHVSKLDQKPVDAAARELGKKLAEQLDEEAPKMQQLKADDLLYDETIQLLDLSDWCASVDGYGNVFLAQRSLDLAVVGVARLTANLEFPLEKIDSLLARLNPTWLSIESNFRVLNKDAGLAIFTNPNREEMVRTYGSGQQFLEERKNPALLTERLKNLGQWRLVETPEIKANLDFFDSSEIAQISPITLSNTWNYSWHIRIINGLELQNISKVKALAEFRRVIGFFPEKPVFTEKELRQIEESKALATKHGLKVASPDEGYSSPMAAAFGIAWKKYIDSQPNTPANREQKRYSLDAPASQAYIEIQRGVFFDRDTANTRNYKGK